MGISIREILGGDEGLMRGIKATLSADRKALKNSPTQKRRLRSQPKDTQVVVFPRRAVGTPLVEFLGELKPPSGPSKRSRRLRCR